MIDLLELIPRAHAAARAKGFWDATPNAGQFLMLAISELSEALEAHRKERRASVSGYENACARRAEQWRGPTPPNPADMCTPLFENLIKDSVEDELADAYIRLCDFAGGFEIDAHHIASYRSAFAITLPVNFGAALLQIVRSIDWADVITNGRAHRMAQALASIEALASREGIDLALHIELKLAYNATRARLHAKAY